MNLYVGTREATRQAVQDALRDAVTGDPYVRSVVVASDGVTVVGDDCDLRQHVRVAQYVLTAARQVDRNAYVI